jgi:phosphoglycerate dehydrogenase-like enzyme
VARARRPLTVLVYHPDDAAAYAALIAPDPAVQVVVCSSPLEAAAAVADADVLYAWGFPADFYTQAPRLRWLQVMGAGVDAALVPTLPRRVIVTRAPGVFGPWMAEYVLGWLLWVTQRIDVYRTAQREGRWRGDVMPERLAGKTLLVVGLGEIGRAVAAAALALGVRVLGVSRSGRAVRGVARVDRTQALARALGEADVVTVTVPLTPATRGLIGRAELAAMRPSAWLVNVARGPVIDEDALVDALERRRLAGAILDVFATEPLPPEHRLWKLDNVVITPHIAGPSTPGEIAPIFNDNLARFLRGRPLRHVVDRRRGY